MTVEVEVWRGRLDVGPERLAALRTHLSATELAREQRFARPASRDAYAAARGQLREVLAARLEVEAAAVPIVADHGGKPRLDPAAGLEDFRFNLAHSGERVLIAAAHGREVGADIEGHTLRRRLDALAARIMTPDELTAWRGEDGDDERVASFFAAWTRKEAYAKGLGEGLAVPFPEIELEPVEDRAGWWRARHRGPAAPPWLVGEVEVGPGYSGAVAVEDTDVGLRVLDLPGGVF